ncbi:hypothetical protein ACH5RR_031288 [Cinchona calisaya]|uniref:Uncharacterized protein n=1 Tax=Cinchona calisaya TaxID=153742 RepID=A0ABD2YG43_9GENT
MASSSNSANWVQDNRVDSALSMLKQEIMDSELESRFRELDRQVALPQDADVEGQQSLCQLLRSLIQQIHDLEDGLGFLSTFLRYVSKSTCDEQKLTWLEWLNRKIFGNFTAYQDLKPVCKKIEVGEEEIFQDLLLSSAQKIKLNGRRRAWRLAATVFVGSAYSENRYLKQKLLKMVNAFAKMLRKIELLKQDIKEAYDRQKISEFQLSREGGEFKRFLEDTQWNSSNRSLFYPFSRPDFDEFLASLNWNFSNPSFLFFHPPLSCSQEIQAIGGELSNLRPFLKSLVDISPKGFHENCDFQYFMDYIGAMVIRAAHVSCFCWVRRVDPITPTGGGAVARTMLSDLKHKMDPTTSPDFLEMHIKLLKVFHSYKGCKFFHNLLNAFVTYLDCGRKRVLVHQPIMNMISVVIDKYAQQPAEVDLLIFIAELKVLVREVRSFECLLCRHCTAKYDEQHSSRSANYSLCMQCGKNLLVFNLFAKIWLMETQIFLVKQIENGQKAVVDMGNLDKGVRFLREFVAGPTAENTENGKQIFRFIETVSVEAASLGNSFSPMPKTSNRVRTECLKLLFKILLSKSEFLLVELRSGSDNAIRMAPVHDQLKSLHEGLKFLRALVTWYPDDECIQEKDTVFSNIKAAAGGVIPLYDTLTACKLIDEEVLEKANLLITNPLDNISVVESELKKMFSPVPRSYFPKMNSGLCFNNILLGNLRELLDRNGDSIEIMKHQLGEILDNLEFLGSFMMNIIEQDAGQEYLMHLGQGITYAACEAEYVIESFVLVNGAQKLEHLAWLINLLEKVRIFKVQVKRFHKEKAKEDEARSDACDSGHSRNHSQKTPDVKDHSLSGRWGRTRIPRETAQDVEGHNIDKHLSMLSLARTTRIDEVAIGLDDQQEKIVYQLIQRVSKKRDVVSIVGMPGIGKTTLAEVVYNDPRVTHHFHIRAWCRVSQVHDPKQLLLDILGHMIDLCQDVSKMSEHDLRVKLHQQLRGRTYLIVVDDIWNTRVWDDLGRVFPDDETGSMVLITTRHHDVASQIRPNGDAHQLCLLSDAESWKLLQMKAFQEECCPKELLEVGKKIAKNCQGLPLALVTIAGLLQRNREEDWWEKIAKNINAHMKYNDILGLSYEYLPNYLKACYLYFGTFVGGKDIPVQRLVWLWIAEGLVQKTELESLEDVAEHYLMDLIGRSLVMVAKRRANGGVKECRVHDMLREFCRSKAEEQNFSLLLTRNDEPYASFDRLDDVADFDFYSPSSSIAYEVHRLCICTKRKHFVKSRPFSPCTRSLLFYATSEKHPTLTCDISFISHNFKLLKVLDLECINLGNSFPSGLVSLVLLRYLAICGEIDSVPSTIANLWHLNTFVVKGLNVKVRLPGSIWKMASLRHIHITDRANFDMPEHELGGSSQLHNLVRLSLLCFSYAEDTDKILRRMPNLRKLTCIFFEPLDYSGNQYPRLDFLAQLESVRLHHIGRAREIGGFNFPSNLKILTLSNFRLPWDQISAIGRLQNLEVLKLLSRAFEGKRWNMIEFLQLKFLKLESLDIVEWNLSSDHLPNLQQLVLQRCNRLEEVPYAFAEMPTLQVIEVQWCAKSAEASVRKFKDEGIEGLKVLINDSSSDFI